MAAQNGSAKPAARVMLVDVRCHNPACRRLLCKIELGALKPGKVLEIKCNDCKLFNYAVGDDDAA